MAKTLLGTAITMKQEGFMLVDIVLQTTTTQNPILVAEYRKGKEVKERVTINSMALRYLEDHAGARIHVSGWLVLPLQFPKVADKYYRDNFNITECHHTPAYGVNLDTGEDGLVCHLICQSCRSVMSTTYSKSKITQEHEANLLIGPADDVIIHRTSDGAFEVSLCPLGSEIIDIRNTSTPDIQVAVTKAKSFREILRSRIQTPTMV